IHLDVTNIHQAMKQAVEEVENGRLQTSEAAHTFEQIESAAMDLRTQIAQFNEVSNAVQHATEQVVSYIEESKRIAVITEGISEQVASATNEQFTQLHQISESVQMLFDVTHS